MKESSKGLVLLVALQIVFERNAEDSEYCCDDEYGNIVVKLAPWDWVEEISEDVEDAVHGILGLKRKLSLL